ncbi:MAG: hypothetical protein IKC37_04315 [Clostridia bacterium]|nr:hypothetical protein [Clostridia bacterium]
MGKINGYTEEEAKNLVDYIQEGRQKGKTLTYLFATYGVRNGRAKGSVRNYYYTLMKNEKGDERIVKLLDGKTLSVEKIRAFSEEETDQALRSILAEKSKGLSIRRAIFNLSGGDDKLMLRLQNKYRNTLKKYPERIQALQKEMGIDEKDGVDFSRLNLQKEGYVSVSKGKKAEEKAFLQRRLEKEINELYDRLAQGLKEENERLRKENERLKEQVSSHQKKHG